MFDSGAVQDLPADGTGRSEDEGQKNNFVEKGA
jgi:hypothetical protein